MMRQIIALTTILLIAACKPASKEDPQNQVEQWRLEIELQTTVLPVSLYLAADGSEAWFENGPERVVVPEIKVDGPNITLRFPAFNNTMTLIRDGDSLQGNLNLVKRGYEQNMPVSGAPDPGYRFQENAQTELDVTGRWQVTFTEDEGDQYPAIGEFDQQGSRLRGTFLTPTGDYRFLVGDVDGTTLRLSTFDGAHAFVFVATIGPGNELTGDFWSGTGWHESFVAQKNSDAKLPDPYALTYLKDGYDSLEFTFPDLEGQPVSLSDDKYQGKVILVTISGTWCPNCADEVEFLSAYYTQNQMRGLEIITLLYEHFEEFEPAAAQGRALIDKHNIQFDVLIGGYSDTTRAAETLPMLNHVMAYPTMIFIDRKGLVRSIHTGFSGPGTGNHYTEFVGEFEATMDELLSE